MKLKPAEDMKNYNKYLDNLGTDQEIRNKYLKNNVLPYNSVTDFKLLRRFIQNRNAIICLHVPALATQLTHSAFCMRCSGGFASTRTS